MKSYCSFISFICTVLNQMIRRNHIKFTELLTYILILGKMI